jgi:hypothetical protein
MAYNCRLNPGVECDGCKMCEDSEDEYAYLDLLDYPQGGITPVSNKVEPFKRKELDSKIRNILRKA